MAEAGKLKDQPGGEEALEKAAQDASETAEEATKEAMAAEAAKIEVKPSALADDS